MKRHRKQTLLVNTFGTFGYISCLFLWMWAVLLYLPLVLDNAQVKDLLLPSGRGTLPSPGPMEPSPFLALVALVVTAVVLGITVFIILRAPVTIARTGKKVTTKAAVSLEPLITHGRPLPVSEKRRLTARLVKIIKLLLVLVPVCVTFLTVFFPVALPFEIVIVVGSALALVSVFWFGAQYICAALLHVPKDTLV